MIKKSEKINISKNQYEKINESNELSIKAEKTTDLEEKKKLLKEALKIHNENYNAERMLIILEEDNIKKLEKLDELDKRIEKELKKNNYRKLEIIYTKYDDYIKMIKLEQYLKIKKTCIDILIELSRYTEAIKEAEKILKLDKSDFLEVKYILISLYILLEKFNKAKDLINECNPRIEPIITLNTLMYLKKGRYDKFKEFKKKVRRNNPIIIDILKDNENYKKPIDFYMAGMLYEKWAGEEAYYIFKNIKPLIEADPNLFKLI